MSYHRTKGSLKNKKNGCHIYNNSKSALRMFRTQNQESLEQRLRRYDNIKKGLGTASYIVGLKVKNDYPKYGQWYDRSRVVGESLVNVTEAVLRPRELIE